jgi:hypothetical protein
MNLLAVPPELAAQGWERGREFVYAACARSEISDPELIKLDVLNARALLWLACDGTNVVGAGVTQLFTQAGKKVCEIVSWGARDQKRCAPLLRDIENFARAEECNLVRLVGRKGWAKHMKDYSAKAVVLEKALG